MLDIERCHILLDIEKRGVLLAAQTFHPLRDPGNPGSLCNTSSFCDASSFCKTDPFCDADSFCKTDPFCDSNSLCNASSFCKTGDQRV